MTKLTEHLPTVSVVMPLYNQEPYVEAAVRSLLAQTFSDFELIIIDDGSTDASLTIVRRLASSDERIRVYNQKNFGRAITRNRGVKLARAELMAMLDPDDIAMPERLALQVEYMQEHPECVALGAQFESVCMKGIPLNVSSLPLDHASIEARLLEDDGQALTQGVSMMRRTVCLAAGSYNAQYAAGEDADLFLRMALKGQLANLPQTLLQYRQHPKSTVNTAGRPEYDDYRQRIERAWQQRGRQLPANFQHWSQSTEEMTPNQLMLRWGWNAFKRNEFTAAKYYVRMLLRLNLLDMQAWRLFYCILRGRQGE